MTERCTWLTLLLKRVHFISAVQVSAVQLSAHASNTGLGLQRRPPHLQKSHAHGRRGYTDTYGDVDAVSSFSRKASWNHVLTWKTQISNQIHSLFILKIWWTDVWRIHVNILHHHHYHIVTCSQHLRATAFNFKTKTPMRQIQLEGSFYFTNSILTLLTWLYRKNVAPPRGKGEH